MNPLGYLDMVFISKSSNLYHQVIKFSPSGMPIKKFEVFVFPLRSAPRMKIKLLCLRIMSTFDFYISQSILAF